MLEKGIKIAELLQSDIFCHQFDFEDWPLIHSDDSYSIAPYNDSIFQLRGKYSKTFQDIPENEAATKIARDLDNDTLENDTVESEEDREVPHFKVYKIKYTINVLPGLIN